MKRILFLVLSFISCISFAQTSQSDALIRKAITPTTFNGLVKQGTIAQLRAMSPNPNDLSTTYFCTENGKEGNFKADFSDNSSVDNLGVTLVCKNGVRLKRVFTGAIYCEWFGAKNDGITDCTNAIQKAFDFANTTMGTVKFNDGFYVCGEVFVSNCRIKEISSNCSNLGEATNEKKTTIVSKDNNQRFIWKFGGKLDFSSYGDVETYSTKGLKISVNFSSKYKQISKAALCLECFTSGDLECGFFEIVGTPLYCRNMWETELNVYFRRIKNFGGSLMYFDDALINIGANTSELNFNKITVGQTDCSIIKASNLSYFGKVNIQSLIFEHNGIFFDSETANPTKYILDNSVNIDLFDFGYADGIMMNNISLCGLNKTVMYKGATPYKYNIFRLNGRYTINANICVYDCNANTYLTSGEGIKSGLLNVNLTQAVFNRSSDASKNEYLNTYNFVHYGQVRINDNSKKQIEHRFYNVNDLCSIISQQNINGTVYFCPVRENGEESLNKQFFNYQIFLEGIAEIGLKARLVLYSNNSSFNVQYIGDNSTITTPVKINPSVFNTVVVPLYNKSNNNNRFNFRTINSNDSLKIKSIEFFIEDDYLSKNVNSEAGLGIALNSLPVINATQNNDILYGLYLSPTFNNNGFTGVTNYALRVNGSVNLNGHIYPNADNNWVIGSPTSNFGSIRSRIFESVTGDLTLGTSSNYSVFFKSNGRNWAKMLNDGNLILDPASAFVSTGERLQVLGTIKADKYKVSALNTPPSSASDTGIVGEIRVCNTGIFICVASNTWVKCSASSF